MWYFSHMPDATQLERALILADDLAALTPDERVDYYKAVCESAGLNPVTKPFTYLTLDGKYVLYATRACTDQLRKLHNISVVELTKEVMMGLVYVVVKISDKTGRTDIATGAVAIEGIKGDALANAFMKAETKAKRRATLSICGLGMLDESELETLPPMALITPPAGPPQPIPQATTAPAVNQAPAPPEVAKPTTGLFPPMPPVDSDLKAALAAVANATPEAILATVARFADKQVVALKETPVQLAPPVPPPAPKPAPAPMSPPPVPQSPAPSVAPAPSAAPAPPVAPAQQAAPVQAAPAAAAVPPPVATGPAPTGADAPATPAEYQVFIGQRAAKVVRDKLAPAGLKFPGDVMKIYLLKKSGFDALKKISAATFERLIGELENATPADAVKLVTEGAK